MNRILVAALICGLAAPAFSEERPIGTGLSSLASRSATAMVLVDPATGLPAAGTGGGPATIASGAVVSGAYATGSIVDLGAQSDTSWSGSGNGSLIAIMKAIAAGTAASSTLPIYGQATTATPSYTNATANAFSLDLNGGLRVQAAGQTPAAGTASAIVTGGTALVAVTGPVRGCYITNPTSSTDQAIGSAENLYVNPVTTATTTGNGTTLTLVPGQSFFCVPGQTTNVSVVAATTAHAFTVVKW
jgi:hypothetical protein